MNCKHTGCNAPEGECSGACLVTKRDDWDEPLRRVFVADAKRRVKSKKQRTQDKRMAVAGAGFDAPF